MKKMKSILAAVTSVAMLFTGMTSFSAFAETEEQTTEETVARLTPEKLALIKEIVSGGEIAAEQDGSKLRMVKVITEEEKDIIFPYLTPNQRASLEEIFEETGEYRIGSVILNPSKTGTEEQETTEDIPVQTDDLIHNCTDDINSELLFEHDFYTISYSFEEFLALNDEEFLALEDVPNSVKKCYKERRHYENADVAYVYFEFNDTIDFGMHGNLVAERREELCELLNIPQEMICNLLYHERCSGIKKGYSIEINEDGYNGYPKEYIQNKLEAYLNHSFACAFPC